MLWVMGFGIIFLLLAVMYAIWGVAEVVLLRRARSAPVQAEGKVCGLVQHRPLMQYEKQGRVPQLAFQYWGRTTGNGAHGGLSIPQAFSRWNSYPCVEFAAGGDTVAWLSKMNPFGMLVVSVFIAMLERGSNTIQTNFKIPASASDLIIGIILFFMLGCEFFITYKLIPRRKEEHHA